MVKTKAKYIQICNSYVVSNSLGCLFPWQYKMYPDKDTGKKFPARKKKLFLGSLRPVVLTILKYKKDRKAGRKITFKVR